MDDIVREEFEDDLLALRHHDIVGGDHTGGLARVIGVVDFPPPLLGIHLNGEIAFLHLIGMGIDGAHGRNEDREKHDGRNDGPDDFQRLVAMQLLWPLVIGASAIAQHGVDDRDLHAHEDDERQEEDKFVQPLDIVGL